MKLLCNYQDDKKTERTSHSLLHMKLKYRHFYQHDSVTSLQMCKHNARTKKGLYFVGNKCIPAKIPYNPFCIDDHRTRSERSQCSGSWHPTRININYHTQNSIYRWNQKVKWISFLFPFQDDVTTFGNFILTSNTHINCLTASAVPWNQFIPFSPDVWVAASSCSWNDF